MANDKMDPVSFAQGIRRAYPGAFDDIKDDYALAHAVIKTHPEMANEVDFGPQHPIIDALNKGFMEQPLPPDAGTAEKVAHFAGASALPAMGGVAGAAAGPAGVVAGTMAGAAVQKAGQSLLQAVAPNTYGEGANQDPISTANNVVSQGVGAGIMEGASGLGKSFLSSLGQKIPNLLSGSTGIPEQDIKYAIQYPGLVFGNKDPEVVGRIYREGITPTETQELLPGFKNLQEQNQPLKNFMEDYVSKNGPDVGVVDRPLESKVAKDSADMAIKAIKNGGKVALEGGETRTLTPQEALNGLQGMNYLRFTKDASQGKYSQFINGQAYDDLVNYLEDNGYKNVRDGFGEWKDFSIAKKFSSPVPLTKKGTPSKIQLGEMGLLGGDILMGHHPLRTTLEVAGLAAQSPWLVGKGIQYGVPAINALAPIMNQATTPTNLLLSQLALKGPQTTQDDETK